ncbi:DUF1552 domain-containing protein [Stratiformator vulcanicus]|uniref:DUF1552 domain-containing protein n=1 Tax=Stratiformator vulcanicus TaxID=2527980 RepID=A0A517R5V7_9PLAN|nr:DUF1552 domain-containing protein [Stratiformator vulcanicus]QDT39277.1 hypothetical protein Pan189_36820 [Stratiformator vulcanicus]
MKPRYSRNPLDRRSFLKGAGTGVVLGLPMLEAMSRNARSVATAGEITADERPKRSVFTFWGLGMNGRDYTPKATGKDYQLTPILKPLARHRDDFTVISGLKLTHSGGHGGDRTFLTGTATHDADTELRISADQELAEAIGHKTRFPSLQLGIRRGTGFGAPQDNTCSWTRSGTPLPAENRPHALFEKLFRPETPESIAKREQNFGIQESVLDSVRDEAKRLNETLGKNDRERLEEYFTSIRDLENKMSADKRWLYKPKPEVARPEFGDEQSLDPDRGGLDYVRYQKLMYDVIALALQTDSTRVISYMARKDNSDGTGAFRGSTDNPYGYHTMTHHGEDNDKLKWWTIVDTNYMELWAYLLDKLKGIKEGDGTLLDHTLLAWGSSGGTVNAHNRHQLPTMICGGSRLGVNHQGHVRNDDQYLGNLWQTMFGVMGVPVPEDFQGGEADGVIKEIV